MFNYVKDAFYEWSPDNYEICYWFTQCSADSKFRFLYLSSDNHVPVYNVYLKCDDCSNIATRYLYNNCTFTNKLLLLLPIYFRGSREFSHAMVGLLLLFVISPIWTDLITTTIPTWTFSFTLSPPLLSLSFPLSFVTPRNLFDESSKSARLFQKWNLIPNIHRRGNKWTESTQRFSEYYFVIPAGEG